MLPETLEAAVEAVMEEGYRTPPEIAEELIARHGETWVWTQIRASDPSEILSALIRMFKPQAKPSKALAPMTQRIGLTRENIRVVHMWIPDVGYKIAADVTSSDLRARAGFHDAIARGQREIARHCQQLADTLDQNGWQTLGEFEGELPSLNVNLLASGPA